MKRSISEDTQAYLQQLEVAEKAGSTDKPAEYTHHPDTIDELIRRHNLRIIGLNFYADLDLMLIVLSNCKVMKRRLSEFNRLQGAAPEALEGYELSRYGVHWPALDEDLSLKGFLQHEITHVDRALVA